MKQDKNIRHNIGDRVIALTSNPDSSYQPRKKGDIITVLDTMYCCRCGVQAINFTNILPYSTTCDCECGHEDTTTKYWTYSHLFAKIDEDTLNQLVEDEEYELAAILTKELVTIEQ